MLTIQAATNDATATCYFQVWHPNGTVYSTVLGDFEAFNSLNWANYAISMTRQGSSYKLVGTFPEALENTGVDYTVTVYMRDGASPAATDLALDDDTLGDQRARLLADPDAPLLNDATGALSISNLSAVAAAVWAYADRTLTAFTHSVGGTAIDAIKTVTDTLSGMLEDATGWRWTTKALEQGPISDATAANQDLILDALVNLPDDTAIAVWAEDVDGTFNAIETMQLLVGLGIGKMVKTGSDPLTYDVYAQDGTTVLGTLTYPLDKSGRNNL